MVPLCTVAFLDGQDFSRSLFRAKLEEVELTVLFVMATSASSQKNPYYILIKQKLSEGFLTLYREKISQNKTYTFLTSRYQKLTENFINNNKNWLDLQTMCNYQELSYEFLKNNIDLINIEWLKYNPYYNKENRIQIIYHKEKWYIIDAPIVDDAVDDINTKKTYFCKLDPS